VGHPPSLRQLFRSFLKIGLTSFGGPLVAMSLIHREVVENRRWVSPDWFSARLGLLEAIPGPSAAEMSVSVGLRFHGRLGGLTTGLAYVLPGFFIMVGLSALYFRFGSVPLAESLLAGLKPATMAVLGVVTLRLSRSILRDRADAALWGLGLAASLLGASIAGTVLACGLARWLYERRPSRIPDSGGASLAALAPFWLLPAAAGRLPALFLGCFKAGALVTGGGYVMASFLSQDFVVRRGWLSPEEFLAGLALAQFKPGPVILLAAFVGYKTAGVLGACVASFGVFLPCFGALLAVGPALERLHASPTAATFLRGMGAAAVGSILAVAIQLFPAAVSGVSGWGLFLSGLAGLYWLEPGYILAAAALLGLLT